MQFGSDDLLLFFYILCINQYNSAVICGALCFILYYIEFYIYF
jgi:hypothetical protein